MQAKQVVIFKIRKLNFHKTFWQHDCMLEKNKIMYKYSQGEKM